MSVGAQMLWDIPTRLFHWLIVCCLPLSWWSAETGNYEIHQWSGYTVIVLVVRRVIWGFVGSRHSRFDDFIVGPAAVRAYMQGQGAASAGHNPLGGWSVLLLLSLLLIQAVSGLFNSDEILFSGPLYYWADADVRAVMGSLHDVAFNGLLALVAVHIVAVLYHQFKLKEKLLQAMVRGQAKGRAGEAAPAPWWLALALVVVIALALWWGLQQAPRPAVLGWG